MESNVFRSGKFAGIPLTEIPKQYLQWAYVNLEAMSPATRSQVGLMVADWLGSPSKGLPQVALPTVAAKREPDLAELLMQTLEYYAGRSDGEHARAMLARLYRR